MSDEVATAKRILQVKVRASSPDATAMIVSMMRNALPLYEAFGQPHMRLLRDVDDQSVFLQAVEYEVSAAFELNRHRLASDPMLQAWRAMFSAVIEIEVYEDVTATL